MGVTIHLTDDIERRLRDRAVRSNLSLEDYVRGLAERDAATEPMADSRYETFDSILAPARQGFAQSGMTDEEIDAMFEDARDEVRRERKGSKG